MYFSARRYSFSTQAMAKVFSFKFINLMFLSQLFALTRSFAALRAADLGLSGQDAFRGRTFGRFPASLFSPLALSSNWILILIQLLQVKDRQNVTHKQTDTVSEIAHFS